MQKWIQPPTCLDHGLQVIKPRSFLPNRAPKCGRDINFSLDYSLWVKNSNTPNPNQKRAARWRILLSTKSAPANRKTGFYANHDPNEQEAGFILAWSGSELEVFQIFKNEIKKSETYSGCPFQGLSNGTTLMYVQSGRTVPLKIRVPTLPCVPREATWLLVWRMMTMWHVMAAWDPKIFTAGFSLKKGNFKKILANSCLRILYDHSIYLP
jgi:hypothetical protein